MLTVTNPLGKVTSYTWANGLEQTVTDPLSHTTSYTYDNNSRLTQITAPEGNAVQYGYDSRGNVTTTTNVAKSGSGLANIVTSASFDATCNNLVKCNKPNTTTDNATHETVAGGSLTIPSTQLTQNMGTTSGKVSTRAGRPFSSRSTQRGASSAVTS